VDNEDPVVRSLAVTWSVELLPAADAVGQRALSDLLHRLSRDGNQDVQRSAVLALGRVNDSRAFDQVKLMLRRGQPSVRAAAAHALAQQARGSSNTTLQHLIVPLLQKALDDPALEVVVAAAEDLGTLGVPEAGPVLIGLLKHSSESVRQTAAQALEQIADLKVLEDLLPGLDDPAVTVRFSLVGAIGHAVDADQVLTETQRSRLISRLEELVLRDADAGVRSRAATVLGQCSASFELPFLYRRVIAREDSRVQEKAFAAFQEIIVRSGSLDVLREWDRTLAEARQGPRRLQLLTEVSNRWKQTEKTRLAVAPVMEILVQAQINEGKWSAAFPIVRELLGRPGSDAEMSKRLSWLLTVGELALQDGNRSEALLAVQEAQAFLGRRGSLAAAFERLEKRARQGE
jgi:HEAT repeat protein